MSKQIDDWELGTSEIVSWKSKDGTLIEGVLHKPHSFDADRKYPLLVVIHGGPTGIDIRNGLQLQCISCGMCVDACDTIMDGLDWPRGLVGYGLFG